MQEKTSQRRSNRERTEETKAALLKAARKLFVTKGYAETSTPEIVKAAGITRGALYHHFTDKQDLFRAVVRAEFETVSRLIEKSATHEPAGTLDALMQGSRGFLDAMADKERVRLMLLDGPAVLGRKELDEIDRETSANELRLGLEAAMKTGEIKTLPLDALTTQLSAMFDRAALGIASGEDKEDHLKVFEAIFVALQR